MEDCKKTKIVAPVVCNRELKGIRCESSQIGAEGFGLNQKQREAIVSLWSWQESSLACNVILGGPAK